MTWRRDLHVPIVGSRTGLEMKRWTAGFGRIAVKVACHTCDREVARGGFYGGRSLTQSKRSRDLRRAGPWRARPKRGNLGDLAGPAEGVPA